MKKINLSKKIKRDKKLFEILKKHSGRDNTGSISVRHQGKRQKRFYRFIDFRRDKKNIVGKVISIEKDPNRNTFIAKINYSDNEKRYILYPKGLKIGDKIVCSKKAEIKVGNALPLKNIPVGVEIHNLEINPGMGGKIIRGAGNSALVLAKEDKYVHIKLPSGETRKFLNDCYATIGVIGNENFKEQVIGKAGRKIRIGIRPTVRGTVQNPRTHPHGGGEGKVGEGMNPKTPWGKPARGKRTRNKNKWSNKLIIQKRK